MAPPSSKRNDKHPKTGASTEHQQLAHTIKNVHRTLRDNTRKLGAQRAWTQHLQDSARLQSYSSAMRTLATGYWEANTASKAGRRTRSSQSTEHNRIAWSVHFCAEYFGDGTVVEHQEPAGAQSLLLQQRQREQRILEAMTTEERAKCENVDEVELWTEPEKLRLLDVGSCYNPFGNYAQFEVTAVDIAPAAAAAVHQCDFLALRIIADKPPSSSPTIVDDQPNAKPLPIQQLAAASFDVVVFSLLLEYMPTSEQRLHCCRNAYDLLRPEGVLIIITPDSKHVGANARLMKTWRYALSLMGLSRVRCEKLEHLTCMVFRRSPCPAVAQRWAQLHREEYMENVMNIPQDFAADGDVEDEKKTGVEGVERRRTDCGE